MYFSIRFLQTELGQNKQKMIELLISDEFFLNSIISAVTNAMAQFTTQNTISITKSICVDCISILQLVCVESISNN